MNYLEDLPEEIIEIIYRNLYTELIVIPLSWKQYFNFCLNNIRSDD